MVLKMLLTLNILIIVSQKYKIADVKFDLLCITFRLFI